MVLLVGHRHALRPPAGVIDAGGHVVIDESDDLSVRQSISSGVVEDLHPLRPGAPGGPLDRSRAVLPDHSSSLRRGPNAGQGQRVGTG